MNEEEYQELKARKCFYEQKCRCLRIQVEELMREVTNLKHKHQLYKKRAEQIDKKLALHDERLEVIERKKTTRQKKFTKEQIKKLAELLGVEVEGV